MHFILLAGIFGFAIMVERVYTLYIKYSKPIQGFRAQLKGFLSHGDYKTGLEYIKETTTTTKPTPTKNTKISPPSSLPQAESAITAPMQPAPMRTAT